jgi:hypothetical protein
MTAPRLHVLTAADSPEAVVLRRGPAEAVATIGWDRETGAFTMGQWMHGRLYEHRADLSPDGRHMIYFARRPAGAGQPQAFTAISRAPWLRALVFLPQESTWGGGGAFTGPGEVWLNGGAPLPADAPPELRSAPPPRAYPSSTDGFHMGATFAATLQRRGWEHLGGERYDIRLARPLPGGWRIELAPALHAPNRALISLGYALAHPGRGLRIDQPDWQWAEAWGDGLHFAAHGCLYQAGIAADGTPIGVTLLRDFAGMRFEPLRAPYDAGDA